MRSNFNTAPTHAPEVDPSNWDYGTPISGGMPTAPGGAPEWASPSPSADTWDTGNDWASSSASAKSGLEGWDDYQPAPQIAQESGMSERLRSLKDKVVHGMGRKALDAVMNRLPALSGHKETIQNAATNLYENPGQASAAYQGTAEAWSNRGSYAEQAVGYAKSAGREVAGAGTQAAKESVMKYYGLEKDENEKLRVARKIKFGKAVVKTLVNPVGTASSVGTRAGYAARKAVKQEAVGQFKAARENFSYAPAQQQAAITYDSNNW